MEGTKKIKYIFSLTRFSLNKNGVSLKNEIFGCGDIHENSHYQSLQLKAIPSKSLLSIFFFFFFLSGTLWANNIYTISGTVKDKAGNPIYGAVVLLEEFSEATITNKDGHFKLQGNFTGSSVLEISYLGFKTFTTEINFSAAPQKLNIVLTEATEQLSEAVVSAKSKLQQIEAMAFNVDVLDAEKLHNTTLDISQALNRVSGVKVRRSGGVGSRMNISLNGFTGDQVKIFIDGIPMENFGTSYQLSNIPINLAERIEVYKGVVPVGLGADALGGAINIVTNKYQKSHLEVSYSYGSFNTHRSSLNAIYVAESGFTAQLNAFQNYSDNDYWVTVDAADLNTGEYFRDQRVRRFHDTYHNETLIANIGVLNKSYADKLLFGIVLGQNYNEIQTGARQVSVFGSWYMEGTTIMPTLKYKKSDFLIEGLDVVLNANYNFGKEKVVDTVHRRYNWFGDYIEYDGPGGERNYTLYEYQNNNAIVTASAEYEIDNRQEITLSNTFTSFDRVGKDKLEPENIIYQQPRETYKNILGLAYKFEEDNWSSSVFMKHYAQVNRFAQSYNPTGIYGDIAYINKKSTFGGVGYGITGSYFINDNFQVKASYEKTYRLPSAIELFGNLVTLEGNIDLGPEKSNNYNLGANYFTFLRDVHQLSFSGNIFYRDAKDFIRAKLNKNQTKQVKDNLFNVENLGFTAEASYWYKNKFNFGGNITYQNLRNNTRFVAGQTTESVIYGDRIPSMPYLYGNLNAAYNFISPVNEEHSVNLGYDMLYVHEFYLYWPSLGSDKLIIPRQISHNIDLTYTLGKEDNLHLTLEARNITDNKLYDNFSLQKPGRAFYGKIRYTF